MTDFTGWSDDELHAHGDAKREQRKREREEFEEQLAADFLRNPIGLWISELDEELDAHLMTPAVRTLHAAYKLRCLSEVDGSLWPTVAAEFAVWARACPEAAIDVSCRALPDN